MELQILGAFTVFLLVGCNGQENKVEECQDKGPCPFVYKPYCATSRYRTYMETRCPKFCGYCKPHVPCHKTKYGCCLDKKTPANGPHYAGCPLKLCYDYFVAECKKIAAEKRCNPSDPVKLARRKSVCPYSCGFCKHKAPGDTCKDIGYGCCWDGTAALGKDNKGCPPCVDFYRHSCSQWGEAGCKSGSYRIRTNFMERYCPVTCGFCPECRDISKESLCRRWKSLGFCKKLKASMKRTCAKTCHLCAKKSVVV